MSKKEKVLIVDDELYNRKTYPKILSDAGYSVSTVSNKKETFKELSFSVPGLILLNTKLGKESGFSILEQIRKDIRYNHIYIVLISKQPEYSHEQDMEFELGADGYLTFPLEKRELLVRINTFFRHKKALDALRKSEKKLAESEKKYCSLFEHAGDGIIIHNLEGNILDVNKKICDLFGYTKEEFCKTKITDKPELSFTIEKKSKQALKQLINKGFVRYEAEFLSKSGEKIWGDVSSTIINISGEKIVYEVFRDITKQKLAEFALKERELRYQYVLEATSDAIWDWNLITNEQYFSPGWFKILGYEPNEFEWTEKKWKELLHPDDFDKSFTSVLKAAEQYNGYRQEFRIRAKDGRWRWILARGEITDRDKTGKATRISGTYSDITKRKKVEEKLSYQAQLLESVSESVISTDNEFKITSWNKAAEKLYGWQADEVLGKEFKNVIHPIYNIGRKSVLAKFYEEGFWNGEVVQYKKNGDELIIHASVTTLKDGTGNIIGTIAVNRDITDKKQAEKELVFSKKRYQTLFNNSPVSIWEEDFSGLISYLNALKASGIIDLRTFFDKNPEELQICAQKIQIIDINDATLELHEAKSKEELLGNLDKILTEKSMSVFKEEVLAIANGIGDFQAEGEVRTLTGKSKHILLKLTIGEDENNTHKALVATLDITDRKQAEIELKKQTEHTRNLLKTTIDGYILADATGQIIDVNPSYCKLTGYSKEELLLMNINELEVQLDPEQVKKRIGLFLQEGGAQFETKHRSKNGKLLDLDVSITITQGEPPMVVAFVRDITKRKIIEKELKESERKINTLMSNLPGMAYRCIQSQNWSMKYVSEGCAKLTGYKAEELIDDKVIAFGDLMHPDDKNMIWSQIDKAVKKRKQFELEYRIIDKDKNIKWVWEQGIRIYTKSGEENVLEGFISDITERKLAQEKITISEKKYRLLAENAVDVVWQMDLKLKFTYVSPSVYNIFGYTAKEWDGSKLSQYTTRKEFFKIARQILFAIKDYKKFNHIIFEAKMLKKGGVEIPVEITGRPIFNENGLPIGVQGSMQDITERKLAEAEIFAMDNKLKLAMSAAKEGIWEWNLKTDQIYKDDVILEMLGYSRKEFKGELTKGKWWAEQVHAEDKKYKEEKFNQYLNGKANEYNVDFRLKTKEGKYIWVKSIAKLLEKDHNNQPIVIGVHRDISKSKKTEAHILEINSLLSSLIESPGDIIIFSLDRNYCYTAFNKKHKVEMRKMYNVDIEIGKCMLDYINVEEIKSLLKKSCDRVLGGESFSETKEQLNSRTIYEFFWNPIFEYKKIIGLSCFVQDITERYNAELEIKRARDEYYNLFKNVHDAVIIFDPDGEIILEANDAALKMYGFDRDEFIGMSLLKISKEPDSSDEKIQKTISKTEGVEFETLQFNKKGDTLYIDVRAKLISYHGKKAILTINHNITALKEVEKKLLKLNKELEQRVLERTAEIKKLSEAVVHSPAIVIITDPEGIIEYVNPKFTEVTGYTFDEVIGQNPRILNAGFHKQNFFTNLWETIKSGRVWKGEICNKKKNREIFWEHTSISSIKTKDNEITHFIAVKEDITLQKKMEEELKAAKEEAEVANKTKSEFLANMSHEIRTPMNAVLGFADLLSNMVNDELQKNYLDSIKSSGKSLLTLINDILDLSKIEAGMLDLQYTYVDLHDIFNEMKTIFSLISNEKRLEFIVDIESSMPLLVLIDETRLRQIIINLLSNAFKFTSKGYIKLTAQSKQIAAIDHNHKYCDLIIKVEDTGIGISKESRNKVFESFIQQEGQSTKKYGGTGLGLAISQRLANLMNGKIELKSQVNKGSAFSLLFKNIQFSNDKFEKRERTRIDINSIEFLGSKVLIVDDITDNRRYLAGALMNYELDIMQASDGKEALDVIKTSKPDLIITDLRMNRMDGFQLIEVLQKKPNLKDIPVIATSASAMKNSVEKVKKANFSGFLAKPFHIEELLTELIKHVPYKKNEKEVIESVIDDNIGDIDIADVNDFLSKLDYLTASFEPLKEQQAMQDVEIFAKNCISFAKEFKIHALIDYGNQLMVAINSFDIELMLNLLNGFYKLVNQIKKLAN